MAGPTISPLRRHIRCEVNDIGVVAVAADAKKLQWR